MSRPVVFVLKDDDTQLQEAARELIAYCQKNDLVCTISDDAYATALNIETFDAQKHESPLLIVTLGGDGTLLRAVRLFQEYQAPFLGVKMGKLGFLTGATLPCAKLALDRVFDGTACVEKRNFVHIRVFKNDECISEERALNEVVIGRASHAPLITARLAINGHALYTSSGDGLIVSTSTGSTAYALSAGGPIMSPEYAGLVVVPLASHTLIQRAVVTAPQETITIDFPDDSRALVELTFDGIEAQQYDKPQRIEIASAQEHISLIKLDNRLFYDTVAAEFFRGQQEG